ncbi:MAG: hypothetical protein J07HQX50_01874 [Haloquadratum sp. J07HQX50]|nr:MAG: hypothetical protein J07HQX50_01874 [Haloquadratum sp. J07HQX50]
MEKQKHLSDDRTVFVRSFQVSNHIPPMEIRGEERQ